MMTHKRSIEWHALIDAANDWQHAYDLLMYWEGVDPYSAKSAAARVAEQTAYDAWSHALVAFERAENGR